MISIFTTTKDFTGINRTNQLNAIRSWLNSPFRPQVIIFGKSIGSEELGTHPNLEFHDQVKISSTGAPYVNEMFAAAGKISKYPVCCYVNADIIFPHIFIENIQSITSGIKKKYLIVGQRIDVDVNEEILFSANHKINTAEKYFHNAKEHPPMGSDFFVFPKGQYTISNMPDLLIGRPAWDNWMIYDGRKRNYKVIDMSFSSKVIHQNHDYSHNKQRHSNVNLDSETLFNRKKFDNENDAFLFTLLACNYIYIGRQLKVNNARGDKKVARRIEHVLNKNKLSYRIKWKIKRSLNKNIDIPYR